MGTAAGLALRLSPWTLPLGLFVCLLALVGFWGINIEDGGLIPALSQRILLGETPHADFISPMPVGAAVLHLFDVVLPLPLVLASKVVTISEFIAYGIFFALLIYRKRLDNLSIPEAAGAVVAVLVGLHQFPVISFYTVDGLVLCSAAFLLAQRAQFSAHRPWQIAGAFFLLGVATTTKQSFWVAPFYVFAVLAAESGATRQSSRQVIVCASAAIGACAMAPIAYVLWVAAGGGFHEMWLELTHTSRVYGTTLLQPFRGEPLYEALFPTLALFACLRLAAHRRLLYVDVTLRIILSALLLYITLREQLKFNGNWSQQLFWCTAAVWLLHSIERRRIDPVGLTVLCTGWMVTLSYGAPTPALAAGACVLYLGDITWRGIDLRSSNAGLMLGAGAVIAASAVAAVFVSARLHSDYGVARRSEVWSVGGGAAGVSTDRATARYLTDAKRCLAEHPAKWKAVLPEGALADALFHVRNPFPLDWFWPDDYVHAGGRDRLIEAATRTNENGDYLLLFQTNAIPGPNIPGKIRSFVFDPQLGPAITSRLTRATRYQCGEFIAFYDPHK